MKVTKGLLDRGIGLGLLRRGPYSRRCLSVFAWLILWQCAGDREGESNDCVVIELMPDFGP